MAVDPSVVAALVSALEREPDNRGLRMHLAQVLLADDPAEALRHAQELLRDVPDDREVLELARSAAIGAGADELAAAYGRLLGGASLVSERSAPVRADDDGVSLDDEAAVDAFLEEVLADTDARVTLDDVAGLDAAKKRIEVSFLGPLRNPALRKSYGKSLRGGLLLYGPPGCGKTFLARAVAGTMGARFVTVGLHDVLDMWLGSSEQRLHAIFDGARRLAPCVLFLDEVDAIGMRRSNLTHSAGRNVVAQLLAEFDGVSADNEGVFVIGATNAPWDVDPALRRPGRFDRTVLVVPPHRDARVRILAFHLRDRPTDRLSLDKIAARTDGLSGADLRLICDSATELALERSYQSGSVEPITQRDLEAATRDVRPTTREWFETARNVALFGNESGVYDDLAAHLRSLRML